LIYRKIKKKLPPQGQINIMVMGNTYLWW